MILFKIAWRNLWRNPLRSGILMAAMTFGIIVMIFVSGFYNGFLNSFVSNSINKQHGHIQIHHKKFREFLDTRNYIESPNEIENFLDKNNISYSNRTVCLGLVNVAGKSSAIKIIGIDSTQEKNITQPEQYKIEGKYLKGTRRNPAYISSTLAEKLGVKLKSKIVLTFSDDQGEAIKASFKITGIYDMKNKMLDMSQIIVRQEDLNKHFAINNYSNEFVILVDDYNKVDGVTAKIQKAFPELEVADWKQIAPELDISIEQVQNNQIVIRSIILIALIFGIINTLLMAVLERTHELGMMIAIGLNKAKMLKLILLESFALTLFAGPLGLILAYFIVEYFGKYGIDMGAIAESLEQYGMDPIIKTQVEFSTYIIIFILIAVTNMIGALYPALKAIRLKPAQAIRK